MKTIQKATKLDNELKKLGINVDDPSFDISQYQMINPRPQKRQMFPPQGMAPMGMMPPPMQAVAQQAPAPLRRPPPSGNKD